MKYAFYLTIILGLAIIVLDRTDTLQKQECYEKRQTICDSILKFTHGHTPYRVDVVNW